MTSIEKYWKIWDLKPYNDRTEIPVFPMMVTTYGAITGRTQAEITTDKNHFENWLNAVEETWEIIGKPDCAMFCCPRDTAFAMGLPARYPGIDIDENIPYQFVEKPYFESREEYKKILDIGWEQWYFQYMMNIQNPVMTDPRQLADRYQELGTHVGQIMKFLYERDVMPAGDTVVYPILDNISMIRSMEEFCYDIYDEPELIMDIVNKYQAVEDEKNIKMIKQNKGTRVWNAPMRSSASFISPDMFEEYVWPPLKAMILRYYEAGIRTVIHADGDWLPMLKYFLELPKSSCHIELDGATDIFKAYEILKGWHSIRGDVPSTLTAYGTPEEVREYCEKLIKMGMGGGFMLSTGCELPLNAKVENIKAIMDSVKG